MMGIKERRFDPLPHEISLEDLVPEDNFYRRLEATLDLSFVRELVKPLYARGGRPSVDPVVFFRLQLVMFFEGIRSERELLRVAADRLSVRWYLGYDLHEPLPFHSSLTRARERFGVEIFRRFFEEIVERCAEAGLVWGKELFFDATKVRADADIDSLHSRAIVENHLEGLFDQKDESESSQSTELVETSMSPDAALPTYDDQTLREASAAQRGWISGNGRQDRAYISGSRRRTADRIVSTTTQTSHRCPTGREPAWVTGRITWSTGAEPGSSSTLWSHRSRLPRTVPCSTSCGAQSSVMDSDPAAPSATQPTALFRT